jgi:hypothetical protein
MAALLRGGQGGVVRLKLLLSMLWIAGKPPYDTSFPARAWAALLDLDQPETNGARRVAAALVTLEQRGLIRSERKRGVPTTVFLLDERGTREPYRRPGEVANEMRERREQLGQGDRYVQLPYSFWAKGWIGVLDGSAIAMLLALLAQAERTHKIGDLWFSESVGRGRLDLSSDLRSAGLRQLEDYHLLLSRKQSISRSSFDAKRLRKTYTLRLAQLVAGPGEWVPDAEATSADILSSWERAANIDLNEFNDLGVPNDST